MTTRCDKLVDVGRRRFLSGASVAAVGAAASTIGALQAKSAPAAARVTYPSNRLGNVHDLVRGYAQFIRAAAVVRIHRYTDAGASGHKFPFQLKRQSERQFQR